MRTWITSDQHFNHRNILRFTGDDGELIRPGFQSVEEMNEHMIDVWNQYISPKDKVYHLGDIIMGESTEAIDSIMERLNGSNKILIRGNHDNAKLHKYSKHFKDVRGSHSLRGKGDLRFILSHIPIHPQGLRDGVFNIHGHTHQRSLGGNYINVCVEVTQYMPIDFNSIVEFYMTKGPLT